MPSLSATVIVASGSLTREIFGNVSTASKSLFYLLATASLLTFSFGCYQRWRRWNVGQKSNSPRPLPRDQIHAFVHNVLLLRRFRGRASASLAHILLFSGFVVLLLGTTLVAVEHTLAGLLGRPATEPLFHQGLYYAVFEILTDTFGLAFLAGIVYFMNRRRRLPRSVSHSGMDWVVLGSLLSIGVTGYVIEGLRIIHEQSNYPGVSPVGYLVAIVCSQLGVDAATAAVFHIMLWWLHAILALGLIAAIPYTRLLHVIAGTLNLTLQVEPLGTMHPVSLETVEETGIIGVGRMQDFSQRQLLMLDACVSCGRCEDACPAWASGKPLSPKHIVQDLRGHLNAVTSRSESETNGFDSCDTLVPNVIATESLWSCTTCSACVDLCPLGVNPLGMITDLRRNVVGEGQFRGPAATALQKTQRSGNPWGMAAADRLDWAKGLDVPTVEDSPDFEFLYWVGCAASYDRRLQKIARAVVQLLNAAGVQFAVLGSQERCTGECARRMGDEFLFQELAQQNVATLEQYQVKKVITHCPHCLNSFRKDYPPFGGQVEVVHHSEFLMALLSQDRLPIKSDVHKLNTRVTFHDPCYLARVNGVVEPPRTVLNAAANASDLEILEMPRRGENTSCCGAGGGRMWFDDGPEARIGKERVHEALRTEATCIATGCPFCLTMLTDGVAAEASDVQVRDIAEILAELLDVTR